MGIQNNINTNEQHQPQRKSILH